MAKYVERELTNDVTEPTSQVTELTEDEMERVSEGTFTFKTVCVPSRQWAHDD
ncbi:MAG: hypothetical protein H0V72_30920 [Bradyrhizobium sp.]|nr:hypothetical protein [Bradyrhizobium sp.]